MTDENNVAVTFVTIHAVLPCVIPAQPDVIGPTGRMHLLPDEDTERMLLLNFAHNGVWYCEERKQYATAVERETDKTEGLLWFTLKPNLSCYFEAATLDAPTTPPTPNCMWMTAASIVFSHLHDMWNRDEAGLRSLGMVYQQKLLADMPWGNTFTSIEPYWTIVEVDEEADEDQPDTTEIDNDSTLIRLEEVFFVVLMADGSSFRLNEDGPSLMEENGERLDLPEKPVATPSLLESMAVAGNA